MNNENIEIHENETLVANLTEAIVIDSLLCW